MVNEFVQGHTVNEAQSWKIDDWLIDLGASTPFKIVIKSSGLEAMDLNTSSTCYSLWELTFNFSFLIVKISK